MVTNLRDAKSRFSELVKLAAGGEDVLITVRGEPLAKLTGVSVASGRLGDKASWINNMAEAAAREAVEGASATPSAFWEESRADR